MLENDTQQPLSRDTLCGKRVGASTVSAVFCFLLKICLKRTWQTLSSFLKLAWGHVDIHYIILYLFLYLKYLIIKHIKVNQNFFKCNINYRLLEIFHKIKKKKRDLREEQSFSKVLNNITGLGVFPKLFIEHQLCVKNRARY